MFNNRRDNKNKRNTGEKSIWRLKSTQSTHTHISSERMVVRCTENLLKWKNFVFWRAKCEMSVTKLHTGLHRIYSIVCVVHSKWHCTATVVHGKFNWTQISFFSLCPAISFDPFRVLLLPCAPVFSVSVQPTREIAILSSLWIGLSDSRSHWASIRSEESSPASSHRPHAVLNSHPNLIA